MEKLKVNGKKWYMIATISGKEQEVIQSLKNRIISENMTDFFADDDYKVFYIPHITPHEFIKKNKNLPYKIRTKNLFPGYIFIKTLMVNEVWFLIRNTEYVTGIVGSSGYRTKPTPISNWEMQKMETKAQKIKKDFEGGKIESPFKPGIVVEVIDGPAKGQVGPIIENNDEKQVAIVELIMFERKNNLEIEYKFLKIK